jgi:type IV pilus assembly protein PilP
MNKIAFVFVSMILVACSGGAEHSDLRAYIKEVQAKPAGKIDPVPTYPPYETFIYGSASKRSPFDQPVDIQRRVYAQANSNIQPDFNRVKQHLESFDLSSLIMVGTLSQGGNLWALIQDPSGGIVKVAKGNYMGKNHGKVLVVDNTKIELMEIVSNGLDGWVERPRLLTLAKKG